MNEQPQGQPGPGRRRRRRGGRGGQGRAPQGDQHPAQGGQPPSAEGAPSGPLSGPPSRPSGRPPRRDSRGAPRTEGQQRAAGPPPGPPGREGRIQRAPSSGQRREREGRGGGQREGRGERDGRGGGRERGPRVFEAPVPQDEHSIELGARFKEAQVAIRDARKALEKRKAEFGDEPEWMVEQLQQAEQRFEEIASEWVDHLSQTGRKVVRR